MYHLSVWLHLLAAAVWIGGMVFLAAVLLPVTRGLPPEAGASLAGSIAGRFRWIAWGCLLLLVVTGVGNLLFRGVATDSLTSSLFWLGPFGRALAVKLLVVAAILGSSALHDFDVGPRAAAAWRAAPDTPETRALRRVAGGLGRLNLLLGLLALALGVILVRGWPFG